MPTPLPEPVPELPGALPVELSEGERRVCPPEELYESVSPDEVSVDGDGSRVDPELVLVVEVEDPAWPPSSSRIRARS